MRPDTLGSGSSTASRSAAGCPCAFRPPPRGASPGTPRPEVSATDWPMYQRQPLLTIDEQGVHRTMTLNRRHLGRCRRPPRAPAVLPPGGDRCQPRPPAAFLLHRQQVRGAPPPTWTAPHHVAPTGRDDAVTNFYAKENATRRVHTLARRAAADAAGASTVARFIMSPVQRNIFHAGSRGAQSDRRTWGRPIGRGVTRSS